MSKFCQQHCHERTIEELEAREAQLKARATLNGCRQKELRRIQDNLELKRLRGD